MILILILCLAFLSFVGVTEIETEARCNPTSSNNSDLNYLSYYEGIDDQLMRDIYNLFKYDFKLFGYVIPIFLLKNH